MQHLLIVGTQRSGTSLLTWLLGSQDGIAISYEVKNRGWRRVVGHDVVGVKLCVPRQIVLHRQSPLKRLLKRLETTFLRPLHNSLGPWIRRASEPARWSIKDFLAMDSPLVIASLRDPHEVIHSMHMRGREPMWECQRQFCHAVKTIHTLWKENPDRMLLVDFAALVRKPESVIQHCCSSLQQPFDVRRISGYTQNYGHDGFDKDKAPDRSFSERLKHPIFDAHPQVRNQYAELLHAASHADEGPATMSHEHL